MRDRQAEYAALGIEAIPGGLAGAHREADRYAEQRLRYRQPPNVLRVEGLVAIALRWMSGPTQRR